MITLSLFQKIGIASFWSVGFQNSTTGLDLGFYAVGSYSLREAVEDGPVLDPLLGFSPDTAVQRLVIAVHRLGE